MGDSAYNNHKMLKMKETKLSDRQLEGYIVAIKDNIDDLKSTLKIYQEAYICRKRFENQKDT